MRVTFIPPSVSEYHTLFSNGKQITSRGSGIDDIVTLSYEPSYHRGGGLFSALAGLAKRAFPFLVKNVIVPSARTFGNNVLDDISQGKNLKGSIKKHGINSLKQAALKLTRGGGKKKVKRVGRKKCYKKDIFTEL